MSPILYREQNRRNNELDAFFVRFFCVSAAFGSEEKKNKTKVGAKCSYGDIIAMRRRHRPPPAAPYKRRYVTVLIDRSRLVRFEQARQTARLKDDDDGGKGSDDAEFISVR